MSRYIDADQIEYDDLIREDLDEVLTVAYWKDIKEMPTADVVEVVRCRDCIHAKQHSYAPAECQWYCTASLQYHSDRFFCACGERREDDSLH